MQVAALYDIHGNLPALEAVLREINDLNVDQIVVGGDVIVGPMSRECLDLLLDLSVPTHFIKGNCEVAVLNQLESKPVGALPESVLEDISWTADQVLPEHKAVMKEWPMDFILDVPELGRVFFCHATPRNENEIFTRLTPEEKLQPLFETVDCTAVVCGHTHMQFDRMVGDVRVINAGSVGMPFGKTGAFWLLLRSSVELRHTMYDLSNAAQLITETTYPHAEDFAENNVMKTPSEEAMLELFQKAELS